MACASISSMVKRVASVALWFIATGWAFNYVSLLTGLPSILGLALAGVVSAFVGLDPMRLVWPAREGPLAPRIVRVDVAQGATQPHI